MKVVGAFVKTKGMTIHSRKPSFYFKVLFHTSIDSMGTLWYLDFRSILLKNFFPLSWSRRSSIQEIGYRALDYDFFKCSVINVESPGPIFLLH
jgi:hypothetical protein